MQEGVNHYRHPPAKMYLILVVVADLDSIEVFNVSSDVVQEFQILSDRQEITGTGYKGWVGAAIEAVPDIALFGLPCSTGGNFIPLK